MHCILQFICLTLFAIHPLYSNEIEHSHSSSDDIEFDVNQYKKHIENTTWIVPPATLLAFQYVEGVDIPVSDQTVWIVNRFENGYFFGETYPSFDQTPANKSHLVGSITPLGDVYITFYQDTTDPDTDVVKGIGNFQKKHGKYYFIMQMNSSDNNTTGLSHWSYMISVEPGDYFYSHLPGVNLSVPEYISQF